jgi:heme-degrading monooxygenase HmoA
MGASLGEATWPLTQIAARHKGPETEDYMLYASHTVWQSRTAFEAWTKSEAFRAAHHRAGENKPLYLDHPQFEGFEVRQTVRSGRAAVA